MTRFESPASRHPVLHRHIVLVGLMGAGKSSVGRRLGWRLGRNFMDSDTEIEAAAGCSISDIFSHFGEAWFRDGEKRVIQRLLQYPPSVIATGGGAFIHPETRAAILENAISVWLKADLDVLCERVARSDRRPLLSNGNPRDILARLMSERYPIYAEANLMVVSDRRSPDDTADSVIEALNIWQAQKADHVS